MKKESSNKLEFRILFALLINRAKWVESEFMEPCAPKAQWMLPARFKKLNNS